MTMTPPPTEERTYPYQVFAVVFDHANRMVKIDFIDPDNVGAAGVVLDTQLTIPSNLNEEVYDKVCSVLSDACDLVSEGLEFVGARQQPRTISPT